MTRTETGEYEQCSQYVVDWNLVLNGSKPQNHEVSDLKIFDNQKLAWKNSSSGWEVGACTDGWEYDTENFHRCVKGNTCTQHIFHRNRSAVSDLNWVCDDSWIPAFSQVEWRKSNI